jgi:hypothetical protein
MPEAVGERALYEVSTCLLSGLYGRDAVDRLSGGACARRSGSDRRHQRSRPEDRDHSLQALRKSAIVLKSGASRPANHINSTNWSSTTCPITTTFRRRLSRKDRPTWRRASGSDPGRMAGDGGIVPRRSRLARRGGGGNAGATFGEARDRWPRGAPRRCPWQTCLGST